MAQWPRRRRRANRPAAISSLVVTLFLFLAGTAIWLRLKPESGASASATDPVSSKDRRWLSPDLYGSRSTSPDSGERRWVESADSLGPVVLVVGAPGTATSDWSGVQALLERHGIASIAVVPRDAAWTRMIRTTADSLGAQTSARGRSVAVVTFGRGLDSLLAAVAARPELTSWRLVVMAPAKPAQTMWARIVAKLPRPLRPAPASTDTRLVGWRGSILVAHASDDRSFDSAAAQRIAPAGARVLRIAGGGFANAPRHPADDAWRGILDFIHGSPTPQDVVVPPAADSVTPASTAATPPPPSGIPPLPRPPRR